ncbi:nickel ABC transporter permease subunit NikC [Pseudoroseomonas wenyumeiae]|uniref:Nickel ABC transporter permease subunit NikC n=1 Tax=Teichococcus wenyumeiae TaxID=2478470 RepID=A0A3A9JQ61_9PROT|nr:nickel ABC transporter permease subunit NikC [Pseudoroseomonas wenyumeiae]RKK02778.1 nickel ABC transporter permease subunit NikC [Pseudoroseomonas wenyumeiae]RMI15432.1 nickel ABC transporter permease subunit NikC [Pseudoroseomonas wenyumeiae]
MRRWLPRLALLLLALLLGLAALAPWIAPFDPAETNLAQRLMPPSTMHWLGTDHLGRDLLSRLLWGARASLGAVGAILLLVLAIGTVLGCLAGLLGGVVDTVLMRLADAFMTVPTLVLALFFVGALGTGMVNVIVAIALSHWAFYARLVRGLTLSLRARDHVAAARVAGASRLDIARRHVVPAVAGQVAVLASLDLGHWILHVAGLSFLGLGVAAPGAEWGVMISDARPFFRTAPMLVLLPGAAILLTVMAFNLLGDALRDRLDPALAEHGH